MKLRNKILAVAAPVATIAAMTPIAVTSCSILKPASVQISYNGSKTLHTSQTTCGIYFTLAQELGAGETLKLSYPKIHGSAVPSITEITGTSISVTITDLSTDLPSVTTFDLKFSCYTAASSITPKWEATFSDFTYTKTPS